MSLLHNWAGVLFGSILFAVFWMGTLSVFDEEIDRWMMPGTRIAAPEGSVSLDQKFLAAISGLAGNAKRCGVALPIERRPAMSVSCRLESGESVGFWLNPVNGAVFPDQGTKAGTGFIFPFHFRLYIRWMDIGEWIVGAAAMTMLLLLVSGIVIHRKLFKEFFTFRPSKRLQRSSLDLHNLTGVIGLPFHFVITLSGLIVFINVYFPHATQLAYLGASDLRATFSDERYGEFSRDPAGKPGRLASLDAMVRIARERWSGSPVRSIQIWHPGDANSYVEVRRGYTDSVTSARDEIFFDGSTGQVLYRFETAPIATAHRFISGMHFIEFDHWPLRWLYFVAGLSGCVMIATGFIYWLEARRKRHSRRGLPGVRVVEALTIGSITGIIIATLSFFSVNRLLPTDVTFTGFERAAVEIWIFFLAWIAAFGHAWLRTARGWAEQCWTITVFALLSVVLNAVTTGDHLLKTIASGYWPVAGMDLMLLAGAFLAALTARKLQRRQQEKVTVERDNRELVEDTHSG